MITYIMLYHAVHCDTSTILYCKYIVYITGTAGLMRHGRVLCVCSSDPSQSCVLMKEAICSRGDAQQVLLSPFRKSARSHPAVTWRCLLWRVSCPQHVLAGANDQHLQPLRPSGKPRSLYCLSLLPGLMEGVWEVAQPEAQCEAVGQVNLIGVAVPRRVGLDLVWVAAGNRPAHFRHKRVCKSTCWSSTLRGLAGLGAHLSLSIFSFSASSSLHCSSPSRSRCATHHAAVNIVWPYGTARGAAKG